MKPLIAALLLHVFPFDNVKIPFACNICTVLVLLRGS